MPYIYDCNKLINTAINKLEKLQILFNNDDFSDTG